MRKIDLNCDIGESTLLWPYRIEDDISLLPYTSSINVACGFHAGDRNTATTLVLEAIDRGIAVGAHPSFPDRQHFGRVKMDLTEEELRDCIDQQIEFIASVTLLHGFRLKHVKLHGALYNMAATDHRLASVVCTTVQNFDKELIIYGLSGSEIIKVASSIGLRSCSEVFADRTYQDDGSLTPRTERNALIEDVDQSIEQVLQMVSLGTVFTLSKKEIPIKAETICIHSDGSQSLNFAKLIHQALNQKGIQVSHP